MGVPCRLGAAVLFVYALFPVIPGSCTKKKRTERKTEEIESAYGKSI